MVRNITSTYFLLILGFKHLSTSPHFTHPVHSYQPQLIVTTGCSSDTEFPFYTQGDFNEHPVFPLNNDFSPIYTMPNSFSMFLR